MSEQLLGDPNDPTRFLWDDGDVRLVPRRLTGAERFAAMTVAEQEAAVGVELAAAIRSGKVAWADLFNRGDLGRVEAVAAGDVIPEKK